MNSVQGRSTMMSMLDAQPEEQQDRNGEYWGDESDHLSPIRKHLISTYLQVTDEESMPLLGEYFGVALSFVALGSLVRASNANKRRQRKLSDEERLDLRSCSRFQRMALDSMLRESMERLRNLSQHAYQLEERVKHLVAENFAQETERFELMERLMDSDKSLQELLALRKAEGKANEKVMGIVASKEQDWIKEKKNLQKEVEKLNEKVKSMTREAKVQARRCRQPACEHCKGFRKEAVRMSPPTLPRGRMSLRDFHNLRDSERPVFELPKQFDLKLSEAEKNEDDEEEDSFLLNSIGLKGFIEKSGQSKSDRKGEETTRGAASEGSTSGSGLSPTKDGAKEQLDMESELASILKRVGMLKQRSFSSGTLGLRKEVSSATSAHSQLPVDEMSNAEAQKDEELRTFSPEKTATEEFSGSPTSSSFEALEYASEHDYNSVESPEDSDTHNFPSSGMFGQATSLTTDGELPEKSENIQRPVDDEVDFAENAEKSSGFSGGHGTEGFALTDDNLSKDATRLSSSDEGAVLRSDSSDTHLRNDEDRGSIEAGAEAEEENRLNTSETLGQAGAISKGESESVQMDSEDESAHETASNDAAEGSGNKSSSGPGTQSGALSQPAESSVVDTDSPTSKVEIGERKTTSAGLNVQSNVEVKDFAPDSDSVTPETQRDIPRLERRNSDDVSGLPGANEKNTHLPNGLDEKVKGESAADARPTARHYKETPVDNSIAAERTRDIDHEKELKPAKGSEDDGEQKNDEEIFFDLED